jgi:hypothetical protein
MRERVYRVDRHKLEELNKVYRPAHIQGVLQISPQVWHNYRTGKNDVPESAVDRICELFRIKKNELVLG